MENICKICKIDPTDTLKKLFSNWSKTNSIPSFEFKPVDHKTIRKIILSLKNSGAECREGLSNNIVKSSVDVLVHPMKYLINKIFGTAHFPRLWKLYKLIGLYKGKDKRDETGSYRLISLLSPLSQNFGESHPHPIIQPYGGKSII